MTELEGMKLIKILQSAYPRQEFSEDTILVYTKMLADLPYDLAQKSIYALLATSKFLPTIAEIRAKAIEIGCPVPHAEEAAKEARDVVCNASIYAHRDVCWSHPLISKAVDAMGGISRMGYNEDPEPMWREFRRVYTALREREVQRLQSTQGAITDAHKLGLNLESTQKPQLSEETKPSEEELRRLEWLGAYNRQLVQARHAAGAAS